MVQVAAVCYLHHGVGHTFEVCPPEPLAAPGAESGTHRVLEHLDIATQIRHVDIQICTCVDMVCIHDHLLHPEESVDAGLVVGRAQLLGEVAPCTDLAGNFLHIVVTGDVKLLMRDESLDSFCLPKLPS